MKYTFFFLIILIPSILLAQPSIQWQKCMGGTGNDEPGGLLQTSDGGYIMAGETHSSNGDVNSNHGNYDLWVVKMNSQGVIQWQKTYGGSGDDYGGALIESIDGGYIIAASTNSTDGDLKEISHTGGGQFDIWILKIDSLGNIKWQRTFGGSKDDFPSSIVRGGEGQYIISAETLSNDGDVLGFHGGTGADVWVFSFAETGVISWQKIFGGTDHDFGAIMEIPGGYALYGTTYSTDGNVTGRQRDSTAEVWLVKLNTSGDILWQKTYGGSAYDAANAASPTFDHGYIIAGMTTTPDNGDVSGIHQPAYYTDCWIVKLDSGGNIQWQKCLGGSTGDIAYSVYQSSDSGYVVSASTTSNDGDVIGHKDPVGGSDCWVFKLSKNGDLLWQKVLGGSNSDAASGVGIMPTIDSGFLVETMTWSNDGDVHGLHGDSGNADIWFVKLSKEPSEVKNIYEPSDGSISLYPNPGVGNSTISYELEKPSEVTVEVFNTLGEKLRTLFSVKEDAGLHQHSFDISGLPSGRYFIRIETAGKSVLKAMELIK